MLSVLRTKTVDILCTRFLESRETSPNKSSLDEHILASNSVLDSLDEDLEVEEELAVEVEPLKKGGKHGSRLNSQLT